MVCNIYTKIWIAPIIANSEAARRQLATNPCWTTAGAAAGANGPGAPVFAAGAPTPTNRCTRATPDSRRDSVSTSAL